MSTIGDVLKVNFEGTLSSGDTMMITRAIRHSSGPDVTPLQIATALASRFTSAFANINTNVGTGVTFDLVRLFSINPTTGVMDEVATTPITGATGTGVGDQLPNQSSLVLRVLATPPRRAGRMFLPGYVEGSQSDDAWGVPVVSAAISFALSLLADLTVNVTSEFAFGTWSRSVLQFFQSAGVVGDAVVRSQRRRQTGVGE